MPKGRARRNIGPKAAPLIAILIVTLSASMTAGEEKQVSQPAGSMDRNPSQQTRVPGQDFIRPEQARRGRAGGSAHA